MEGQVRSQQLEKSLELQLSDALVVSGQVGFVFVHQLHAARPERSSGLVRPG